MVLRGGSRGPHSATGPLCARSPLQATFFHRIPSIDLRGRLSKSGLRPVDEPMAADMGRGENPPAKAGGHTSMSATHAPGFLPQNCSGYLALLRNLRSIAFTM